jgi:hypothetical protein
MRPAISLLLCCGCAVLGGARLRAAQTSPSVAIGRTSGPVDLDANLSGRVWLHAPAITLAQQHIDGNWRVGTLMTHGDPTGATDNTLVSVDSTWSTSTFEGDKNLSIATWAAHSSGQAASGNPVELDWGFY